jgi:triphosphoribosyl-dephospho-CoA synthase
MQLRLMSRIMDSHIIRKRGDSVALEVRRAACRVLSQGDLDSPKGRQAYRDFDAWLRSDNHARNPGTTADLIAAMLYVALREQQIPLAMPFVWEEHPFQVM